MFEALQSLTVSRPPLRFFELRGAAASLCPTPRVTETDVGKHRSAQRSSESFLGFQGETETHGGDPIRLVSQWNFAPDPQSEPSLLIRHCGFFGPPKRPLAKSPGKRGLAAVRRNFRGRGCVGDTLRLRAGRCRRRNPLARPEQRGQEAPRFSARQAAGGGAWSCAVPRRFRGLKLR